MVVARKDAVTDAETGITADQVIAVLRVREPELRAAGIRRGSVAYGEARPDSDIDLVPEQDPAATVDLIDLVELAQALGDLFGREVPILIEPIRRPRLRAEVERDSVHAF
jgi:uncharacterized protein